GRRPGAGDRERRVLATGPEPHLERTDSALRHRTGREAMTRKVVVGERHGGGGLALRRVELDVRALDVREVADARVPERVSDLHDPSRWRVRGEGIRIQPDP